jgi:hypothetical protein
MDWMDAIMAQHPDIVMHCREMVEHQFGSRSSNG